MEGGREGEREGGREMGLASTGVGEGPWVLWGVRLLINGQKVDPSQGVENADPREINLPGGGRE